MEVKWPGHEADHSHLYSAEGKNEWSCTSTLYVTWWRVQEKAYVYFIHKWSSRDLSKVGLHFPFAGSLPSQIHSRNLSSRWNYMARRKLILNKTEFCLTCISIYACNEINLMHYLSSVYWITIPLHVSGLLVAHHQEVVMYICDNWYVLYISVDVQHVPIITCIHCYLLMMGY
jgi:hypothetical protein